jgi:formate hydrogenlyase subunit 3/multisubunit Na+/H+ antiporter MnhD subunit
VADRRPDASLGSLCSRCWRPGCGSITALYAIGYMRGITKEKHHTRFYACFAIALFAPSGVAFAQNMLTLFIFYEILTLSTYPLVAHKGTPRRKAARALISACCWAPRSASCCWP